MEAFVISIRTPISILNAPGILILQCRTMEHDNLEKQGYLVIPVPGMTPDARKLVRREMMNAIKGFPEYKPDASQWVMGGFSAFCNPGSFHNPFVRKMRRSAMKFMIPFFSRYVSRLPDPHDWKLEQVIDRLLFRPKGVYSTGESWHRDEASLAKIEDKILGGWWNFDDFSQYFSCVPGTHDGVRGHEGFAPIKDKEEKKILKEMSVLVEIPPGHILIFYEHLIHEVLAKKAREDTHRLFLGWRLTKSNKSLYPNLDTLLDTQAVVPLKSNQVPAMYSTIHWAFWRDKIEKFSKNFKEICTEEKTVVGGKDEGKIYRVVAVHMQSLYDYGFPLYPDYSDREREIYKPNRCWELGGGIYEL